MKTFVSIFLTLVFINTVLVSSLHTTKQGKREQKGKEKKEKNTTNCRQLQELTNIKQHFPKEFPQFFGLIPSQTKEQGPHSLDNIKISTLTKYF